MALKKRHAKRLRQIGGWLLFVIILVFVAEWISRGMQDKLLDPTSHPLLAFEPMTGYTLKPHAVVDLESPAGEWIVVDINSLGIRDREIASKRKNEFRILGLGDALTAALPVSADDTFLKKMEERLVSDSPSGRTDHVINAGVPGYGLRQESRLLGKIGKRLEPNVVLLGFDVGDDIQGYDRKSGLPIPGKSFLQNRSFLYHGLRRAYHRIRGGRPAPEETDPAETARLREILARYGYSFEEDRISHYVEAARDEVRLYRKEGIPDEEWNATADALARIRDETRELGAKMVIALLPTKRQVLPSEWQMTVEILGLDAGMYDRDLPQKKLGRMAAEMGIPAIDLLPVFRSASNPDSLYWPGYPYWTPAAHALAAGTIYDFLAHEDLLKP